ncbi:MAG: hypothetical protein ACK55I_50095, partial [bacterium]
MLPPRRLTCQDPGRTYSRALGLPCISPEDGIPSLGRVSGNMSNRCASTGVLAEQPLSELLDPLGGADDV